MFISKTFYRGVLIAIALLGLALLEPMQALAQDGFKVGGAVRYNILFQSYESDTNENDRQFTWDTWRINVDGESGGMILSFEYRFYPTFDTHFIHHGWIGYNFSENTQMQLGVTQVPFGDLTWASHSWWFVTPYYVGLEDDYDMGLKVTHKMNNIDLAFAYFHQPEPAGPSPVTGAPYSVGKDGRYSYDIIPSDGMSHQERNQLNARAAYNFDYGDIGGTEVGVSAQFGQLYNQARDEFDSHNAFGVHVDSNYGNFNVKAHYIMYNHDVKDDMGNDSDLVYMGAYGSGVYPVAAEAAMATVGVAYTIPVEIGPISSFQVYNDFTQTMKAVDDFEDTQQNTLGCLISAGPVYTYVDVAMGKNHPWLTDSFGQGLGAGDPDADWNTRFNINIGYYF